MINSFMETKKFKGAMSVGILVGMVVVAVVLGSLLGTVTDNTIGISGTGNVTGATATMVDLVPLFLVIAVVLSFVVGSRR